jgi:hypothetical protein
MTDLSNVEFRECPACATKPGAPKLCAPCQHNRLVVATLKAAVMRLRDSMHAELDEVNGRLAVLPAITEFREGVVATLQDVTCTCPKLMVCKPDEAEVARSIVREACPVHGTRDTEPVPADDEDDLPRLDCPMCGADNGADLDGFGCMWCLRCGWCRHPSLTGDFCDMCGISPRCECSRKWDGKRMLITTVLTTCPVHTT